MLKEQRKNERTYLFATCKECGKSWNISRLKRMTKSGYICPHCRSNECQNQEGPTKRIAYTALKYIFLAVLGIALYLYIAEAAEIQRGYKAYGGECVVLLLPLWWFFIDANIKNFKSAGANK